jgi:hypothetical protein
MNVELHIDHLVVDSATGSSAAEIVEALTAEIRQSFAANAARVRRQLDPSRAVTVERLRPPPGTGLGATLTAPGLLTGQGAS